MSTSSPTLELPARQPDFAIGEPGQDYLFQLWDASPGATGGLVVQYFLQSDGALRGNPNISVELDEIKSVAGPDKPLAAFYGYIGLQTTVQEQPGLSGPMERQEVLFPHPDAAARRLNALCSETGRYLPPLASSDGTEIPPETLVRAVAGSGRVLLSSGRTSYFYASIYEALSYLPAATLLTQGVMEEYRALCQQALDTKDSPVVNKEDPADVISQAAYRFIHYVNVPELAKPVTQALQVEHEGIPLSHVDNERARGHWWQVAAAIGGLLGSQNKPHTWGHAMMVRDQAKWLATLDFSVLHP